MRKRENSCRRQPEALQTAHVLTLLPDGTSSVGSCPPAKLRLAGELRIADRIDWTLLDDEFDAGRQLLADVEAARALLIVPIEAIPIRPVARSGWRALLAGSFATPHVLLAVDDSTSMVAQFCSSPPSQRHAQSVQKTFLSDGKHLRGLGW